MKKTDSKENLMSRENPFGQKRELFGTLSQPLMQRTVQESSYFLSLSYVA